MGIFSGELFCSECCFVGDDDKNDVEEDDEEVEKEEMKLGWWFGYVIAMDVCA